MDYIEVKFKIDPESPLLEILIASLSQIGYESFMESDDALQAYIPLNLFEESEIQDLKVLKQSRNKISFTHNIIKDQNWNEVWESKYDPVLIKNLVYIRAPFHKTRNNTKFEIIIDPKMSFGTAHHETTSLMIEMMLDEQMSGKSVMDVGCGTGILAILAEMLGASGILAIDNDEWAYKNAWENITKNKCKSINVQLGDIGLLKQEVFHYVLANINRNVLLDDMHIYASHLTEGGVLLISGFYSEDLKVIESSANTNRLRLDRKLIKNNWVAARFIKI